MDIFFQDPSEVPVPPEEVRIRTLQATPWPDGRRVHIYLEVEPFQKRPNAEILIRSAEGEEVGQASIIEPMTRKIEVTLHLRQPEPSGEFSVEAILFYSDPLPDPQETGSDQPVELPASHEVDRATTRFTIEPPGTD